MTRYERERKIENRLHREALERAERMQSETTTQESEQAGAWERAAVERAEAGAGWTVREYQNARRAQGGGTV